MRAGGRGHHVFLATQESASGTEPPKGNGKRRVLNLGGTIDYFVENTFNYPTLAEGYKVAALDAYNRMGPR
jgi:hypothetical protein